MLMTDETFLASMLLTIPVIRMFQKLGVTHSDQQPPQPPQHQKQPFDKAA